MKHILGLNVKSVAAVIAITLVITACKKADDPPPILFNTSIDYGNMTDKDGNIYRTVIIGDQVWMAENLRVTQFRNGDPVPIISDDDQWINSRTAACCIYNNDIENKEIYGLFYNWYAVSDYRLLAPAGWHIPSDNEWEKLSDYLGGLAAAGAKLKETGSSHWLDSYDCRNDGSNESGFSALPSGFRSYPHFNKTFWYNGFYGRWWTITEEDEDMAWIRELYTCSSELSRFSDIKDHGYSVRCIKDE